MEHQGIEAEAELFISGGIDRRQIVTPSFSRKSFASNALQRFRQGSKLDADSQLAMGFGCPSTWTVMAQPCSVMPAR